MRVAVKKDMAHADASQSKHLAELREKLDKILIEVLSALALLVLYWCFTGTKVRILTQLGEQMHPKFVAAEKLGAGNQSAPFFKSFFVFATIQHT